MRLGSWDSKKKSLGIILAQSESNILLLQWAKQPISGLMARMIAKMGRWCNYVLGIITGVKMSPLEQGSQHSLKEMAGEGLTIASEEAVQVEFPKTFTFERLEAAPLFIIDCLVNNSQVMEFKVGGSCAVWKLLQGVVRAAPQATTRTQATERNWC